MTKPPRLLVIAGPNGSGKTTLKNRLEHRKNWDQYLYLNQDEIAQNQFGDWNAKSAKFKAGKEVVRLRNQCLEHRKNFIVETVLSSHGSVKLIKEALKKGYVVRLFYVNTSSADINVQHVSSRFAQGGHNVPEKNIRGRYHRSLENLKAILPDLHDCYVLDNSAEHQSMKVVFRSQKGRIDRVHMDNPPDWCLPLLLVLRENQ